MIRRVLLGCLASLACLGCRPDPTSALITVESELGAELETIRIEVLDSEGGQASETRSFAASALNASKRLSFGVVQAQAATFLVRASALRGAEVLCSDQALVSFVEHSTVQVMLRLRLEGANDEPQDPDDDRPSAGAGGASGESGSTGGRAADPNPARPPDAGTAGTEADGGTAAPGDPRGPARVGGGAGTGNGGGAGSAAQGAGRATGGGAGTFVSTRPPGQPPTTEPPSASPVSGTVIDQLRRPIPGAEVRLAGQRTTTDAQGRFSFPSAPERYDISFTPVLQSSEHVHTWATQGLTRRDPTLQCPNCWPSGRTATLTIELPTLRADEFAQFAIGSPDVVAWYSWGQTPWSVTWFGPSEASGTLHGLLTFGNQSGEGIEYYQYEARTIEVGASTSNLTLPTPRTPIPHFTVAGRVEAPGYFSRFSRVLVRWDDGATLVHWEVDPVAETAFSYPVPAMADARVAVLSSEANDGGEEDKVGYPFSSSYVDDLTSTRTDLVLKLPIWPDTLAPADGATLDATTLFRWYDENAHVFTFEAVSGNRFLSITSSEQEVRVPEELLQSALFPMGERFLWTVCAWHDYADPDASAERGILGSWASGLPIGPIHGPSTVSCSERRAFTVARP
jgi:hypothetical protein